MKYDKFKFKYPLLRSKPIKTPRYLNNNNDMTNLYQWDFTDKYKWLYSMLSEENKFIFKI